MVTPPPIAETHTSLKRSPPILGTLSILLPAFGAALWLFVAKHPKIGDGLNGFAGMLIYLALIGLSGALVLGGIASAILGLARHERWRLIAIIGLLLNLGIILRFRR